MPDHLCPLCLHEWRRHDPEDGKCDAPHPTHSFDVCPCGRDLDFQRVRNASLSSLWLNPERRAKLRHVLGQIEVRGGETPDA